MRQTAILTVIMTRGLLCIISSLYHVLESVMGYKIVSLVEMRKTAILKVIMTNNIKGWKV